MKPQSLEAPLCMSTSDYMSLSEAKGLCLAPPSLYAGWLNNSENTVMSHSSDWVWAFTGRVFVPRGSTMGKARQENKQM